jgi:hypothetical protein
VVTTHPPVEYNVCTERKEAATLDCNQELVEPTLYQIRVLGAIDDVWSDWFGGLRLEIEDDEDHAITTLTGPVDQAALRGVLNRIWDLNLVLISVVSMEAIE